MLQVSISFPLIKAQNILLVTTQSVPLHPSLSPNGSFHDLQQGSFNLWRMEISVFVYRQLLPFISKLCIWKRRKDLMPLFAAEQMFKDTAESSLSQHNFRGWNWKVLQAPLLPSPWHLVPPVALAAASHPLQTRCLGAEGHHIHFLHLSWPLFSMPTAMEALQKPGKPLAVADKSPCYSSVENSGHAAPRCSTQPSQAVMVKYRWMQKAQIIIIYKVCTQLHLKLTAC